MRGLRLGQGANCKWQRSGFNPGSQLEANIGDLDGLGTNETDSGPSMALSDTDCDESVKYMNELSLPKTFMEAMLLPELSTWQRRHCAFKRLLSLKWTCSVLERLADSSKLSGVTREIDEDSMSQHSSTVSATHLSNNESESKCFHRSRLQGKPL